MNKLRGLCLCSAALLHTQRGSPGVHLWPHGTAQGARPQPDLPSEEREFDREHVT